MVIEILENNSIELRERKSGDKLLNTRLELDEKQLELLYAQLYEYLFPKMNAELNMENIINTCASVWLTDSKNLIKKTRKREVVMARDFVAKILYDLQYGSLTKIGMMFNKSHATILHGIREINQAIEIGDKLVVYKMLKVVKTLGLQKRYKNLIKQYDD